MSTLVTRISDLATRMGSAVKSVRLLVNGNAVDNSALTTTAKDTLLNAINEVNTKAANAASVAAAAVTVNDTSTTSTTQTYSVSKIVSSISAAVANLVASSPAALDTLKELADAIGDDPNYAATTAAALGYRVRYDAAQTLTAAQKVQAKANIDAYGALEIGNPDTDFVAGFNAALA